LIPRVAVVGEIYVRNHPFANNHIIRRLESLGVQCSLSPASEWIYYTNVTRKYLSLRRRQFRRLLRNWIQDKVMRRIEHSLAEPLEKRFGPLAEEPSEHLLRLAKPYLDPCFEGEAILSVGKMIESYHQGFDGVVNVMPFGCMPSTVVASMTTRISRDCNGMPILNLSFDGQEDPALTTRLEAFAEQLRRRKKSKQEGYEKESAIPVVQGKEQMK
jgi:predicted nucleotide-binding protein (sugar kinase/HSP70/actin superfamily)